MIQELLESGKKYSGEKQYDKAIAQFEQILRRAPGSFHAHFELGKVYFLQGRMEPAREELQKAADLDPSSAIARLLLGKACKDQGQLDRAAEHLEKALELGYREENIAKELSDIFRLSKRYGPARSYLDRARENGYPPDEYRKDLDALCREQLRAIQDRHFEGRSAEVLKEIERAQAVIPADDRRLRNSMLNEKEIVERKTVLESKMRSLTFTLTNQCNLRCLMCETRKIPWNLPDRVKEEVVTLFPYIERVMWQGGEAFLYKSFEELLDEAAKHPLRQVLATNGMLMTDAMAEKLVKYNVELTFSIDGATKEVYEHIRPGATFEKVLDRVRLVNELREKYNPGMRTRLNVLVMRANYRQIEEFIEFAHRYRFSTLFFNSAGCDFKNLQENVFYYNHDDEVMAYINTVRDDIAAKAKAYGVTLENWLPSEKFFREMTGAAAPSAPAAEPPGPRKEEEQPGEPALFCHAPWQRLYIDCGGKVRPDCLCPFEREIGNLHEAGLMELWNGKRLVAFREKLISGAYRDFCNNDCVYGRVPKKNLKYI